MQNYVTIADRTKPIVRQALISELSLWRTPKVRPLYYFSMFTSNSLSALGAFEPAIKRRNQVVDLSGLFKINAVVTVLSAFSPRDALLMGYRITQNIMYGNWKRCSLHHKDDKERTAKVGSLYEYFVVKQISKLGAYGYRPA